MLKESKNAHQCRLYLSFGVGSASSSQDCAEGFLFDVRQLLMFHNQRQKMHGSVPEYMWTSLFF